MYIYFLSDEPRTWDLIRDTEVNRWEANGFELRNTQHRGVTGLEGYQGDARDERSCLVTGKGAVHGQQPKSINTDLACSQLDRNTAVGVISMGP